jgi:tripartite-type tricarboxylate transporter receptor subunit TctC
MPQLPTIAEQGIPGYEGVLWIGMMAPAGVPAGTIDLFAAAISEAVRSEGLAARLKRDGIEPVGERPQISPRSSPTRSRSGGSWPKRSR